MTGSLCPVESGVLAVLIKNPHPFNVGCVVRVIEPFNGKVPEALVASACLWVVQATMPTIGYAAGDDGGLVEVKGRMWDLFMVREEDLLVLKTGEDSGPIRFAGEPRDTGAQLAEVKQRTETVH